MGVTDMADIGKHGGKRISAALLAAILSLSLFACGTVKTENTSSADSSDNANNVESVNSTDSSESSESTDTVDTADTADTANTDSSSDSVYVTVGEKSFTAYSDYAQAIRAAIGQLTKYDGTPAVSSDGEWTLMTQDTESETNSFSRVLSSDGWLISAGNGTYYTDSEQLRKAVD
jgi:ABC-type oligopeptide transport system substrate-binding subunit